jgi:hypothetical protein
VTLRKLRGDEQRKTSDQILSDLKQSLQGLGQLTRLVDFQVEFPQSRAHHRLSDRLPDVIMLEAVAKVGSTGVVLSRALDYTVRVGDTLVTVGMSVYSSSPDVYGRAKQSLTNLLQSWKVPGATPASSQVGQKSVGQQVSPAGKLAGRILLQVESRGEAWYVDGTSGQRYYLKDGRSAYEALRRFGTGVTSADLAKIPIGIESRAATTDADGDGLDDKLEEAIGTDPGRADTDGDGYADGTEVKSGYNPRGAGKLATNSALVGKLKGKILLQVEGRGQAWYVNPADGKRYYLKDGSAAYQIMKYLSLGATNDTLAKIPVGELK